MKDSCLDLCNYTDKFWIYVCDFIEQLMCAMSVQDILVEESNRETRLNPMYRTMETKVESDER